MSDASPIDHDPAIREALFSLLGAEFSYDPTTVLLDEFGILEGRHRADVAAVNGALHAYEIKSDRDSLARLDAQSQAYARVFDFVTVVATRRHLAELEAVLPAWCGLWEARSVRAQVRILRLRDARRNPNVDPNSLVQLLWREEAVRILADLGITRGLSGKPRRVVWKRLVETLDSTEMLRLYVRETIKARSERPERAVRTSLMTAP